MDIDQSNRAPDKKMQHGYFLDIYFLFLNKNICCYPSLEPSEMVLMRGHNICS